MRSYTSEVISDSASEIAEFSYDIYLSGFLTQENHRLRNNETTTTTALAVVFWHS